MNLDHFLFLLFGVCMKAISKIAYSVRTSFILIGMNTSDFAERHHYNTPFLL